MTNNLTHRYDPETITKLLDRTPDEIARLLRRNEPVRAYAGSNGTDRAVCELFGDDPLGPWGKLVGGVLAEASSQDLTPEEATWIRRAIRHERRKALVNFYLGLAIPEDDGTTDGSS